MGNAVRRAQPDDAAVLARLTPAVQDWHASAYPDRFVTRPDPATLEDYYREIIADPDSEIALCERNALPVGLIWAEIVAHPATPLRQPRRVLYVHALAVVEQARRQGVGTALMDWAADLAAAVAVDAVDLDHWADNAAASAFYAARGFRPERIVLSKGVAR